MRKQKLCLQQEAENKQKTWNIINSGIKNVKH